nr:glycosyltransferase family 2 protein [uncultured Flavobacterium sp.]
MLSILIPTYNYNVQPLVEALVLQCAEFDNIEVVVFDDASPNLPADNLKINDYKNCFFKILPINVGRSVIRNQLVQAAKYDWILFLDADVMPVKLDFIPQYLNAIASGFDVVYGGLAYEKQMPKPGFKLRWYYGNAREALTLKERNLKKPNDFLCSNVLIKKKVFETVLFPANLRNYGYEDLIFNLEIVKNNFQILQIENEVYHLNIESDSVFLEKTDLALSNLNFLLQSKILNPDEIKIAKYANFLSSNILIFIISKLRLVTFFKFLTLHFPKNILWFDLYKLTYLIKKQNA